MRSRRWRELPIAPNYLVSDSGVVVNQKLDIEIAQRPSHTGVDGQNQYMVCHIRLPNGKRKTCMVHRLVLEAFVGPCPDEFYTAHHKNGNTTDNRLSNLSWMLHKDSQQVRYREYGSGEGAVRRKGKTKLRESEVRKICRAMKSGRLLDREIVEKFNVHRSKIAMIRHGHVWKRIAKDEGVLVDRLAD